MDDYPGELDSVLRYGRLRERSEWQPFASEMESLASENNRKRSRDRKRESEILAVPRAVLADFLAEEGDPRELLVRRHRPTPYELHPYIPHSGEPIDFRYRLDDGSVLRGNILSSTPSYEEGQVPEGVLLHWVPEPTLLSPSHHADVTPEEARAFADRLPDPHAAELHAFLDRHFPRG